MIIYSSKLPPRDFYVYAYVRSKDSVTAESGTPYYIGKGKGKRASEKHGKIPVPSQNNIVILFEGLTEKEAKDTEISLIAQYGRKDMDTGILLNKTAGGDGASSPSAETLAKIIKGNLGRKQSLETRMKRSKSMKGKNTWMKGNVFSEETILKISNSMKGKNTAPKSEEWKANHSVAMRGKNTGPKKIISCPHCGRFGGEPQMHQWHFDKCKSKEQNAKL